MKIVISGLGVMGASLAQAIKNSKFDAKIWGYDKAEVIEQALNLGIINSPVNAWPNDCIDADIVFLATPINVIKEHLTELNSVVSQNTVVTDLGSTKAELQNFCTSINFSGDYIGSHPMTGAEKSGIGSANPLLYENAMYILTGDVNRISTSVNNYLLPVLSQIKARVFFLDAETHDGIMALISHLPQMIAIALMNYVGKKNEVLRDCFELAAGGFQDLTRIASSSATIWQDIISSNSNNVKSAIDGFIDQLSEERDNLENLLKGFESANTFRSRIPQKNKGFISPLTDVLVYVNDQVGVIAKISNALFEKNIDIRDIELLKIREKEGGVFMLSFESRQKATEAIKILKSIKYNAYIKE